MFVILLEPEKQNKGPLKDLNDSKLILDGERNQFRIIPQTSNLSGIFVFFVSYSKPALRILLSVGIGI